MPKRGENIYKRKDGRWEGRIRKHFEDGTKRYQSVYGRSYREVKEKLYAAMQEGQSAGNCRKTLEEAAQLWMQSQSSYWKEGTYTSYRQILDKYVIPQLGNKPVGQITNRVLFEFAADLRQGDHALSRNYIFQICALIRRVMRYLNKQYDADLGIPENPVGREQFPKMFLPSENALQILSDYLCANSDDDTCLGILIALHTGIRVGELSGLTWKDIDLEEEILYIRRNLLRVHNGSGTKSGNNVTKVVAQKPKSSDSVRIIPLPPGLIPVLRKHQKEGSSYVVSGVKATWAEPRTIQYRFGKILEKCQIEHFNFHMLRHAFATRCVSMGVDVKSLSEILGHSNIQLTLNLYVHSTIQQKRMLMQQYDFAIRS